MAGQSDLDLFDVDIRRGDDAVIAAIPQLGLFARGDTEQAALAALEVKKGLLEVDLAAFRALAPEGGVAREPNVGEASPNGSLFYDWRTNLRPFAIKTGIVFALAIAGFSYVGAQVQQVIDSTLRQLEIRGGASFWGSIEREIAGLADPANAMPEEKKQKLLAQIRAIANEWRPFVAAATTIISPIDASQTTLSGAPQPSQGEAAPVSAPPAASGGATNNSP